ncbi:MAG TPA: FprA family A-type flavoprotein [Bacteroidales bacterium]|nr:FprA family A-type flavoprotein [Bacteroidales bacterium]
MPDQQVLKVTEDVTWIGALDRDIVTFDIVMETKEGTTYNSYFINAQKKAVIDTVKEGFHEVFLDKLRRLTNPAEIDYIIVTHTEPDHSGSLKYLLEAAPKAVVYGSRQAISYLQDMVERKFEYVFVKDGDTLDLGDKKITFINAPNLHWPDTMYVWLNEDRLLFTCESFGAHFCRDAMFDDMVENYEDSFKYYFNVILRPFSKFMVKALEKIRPLDINIICPGHGPILRSTWKEKVKMTEKFAEQYIADSLCLDNSILITYVTAYGYTRQMAEAIAEGIREVVDYKINVIDIENILLGELEELITRSKSILIGSPTINQNTLLPVYRMFAVINPLRDKGKKAAAFGSFGWSGEAVKLIENQLRALKLNVVMDGITAKFSPNEEKHSQMVEFGRNFARYLIEN